MAAPTLETLGVVIVHEPGLQVVGLEAAHTLESLDAAIVDVPVCSVPRPGSAARNRSHHPTRFQMAAAQTEDLQSVPCLAQCPAFPGTEHAQVGRHIADP